MIPRYAIARESWSTACYSFVDVGILPSLCNRILNRNGAGRLATSLCSPFNNLRCRIIIILLIAHRLLFLTLHQSLLRSSFLSLDIVKVRALRYPSVYFNMFVNEDILFERLCYRLSQQHR
jgi:hypothetical protein